MSDRLSAQPDPDPATPGDLILLDARPILAGGTDPLDAILAALDRLTRRGVFVLIAPFRPGPLLELLGERGLEIRCEEPTPETWQVEVRHPDAQPIHDLTDLEPPEPMEQVLLRCHQMGQEELLLFRLPRCPRLIGPRLAERGMSWQTEELPDGSALLATWYP